MDLYSFVEKIALDHGYSVNQATKERIISSLRVAGFSRITSQDEARIAEGIFVRQAEKLKHVSTKSRFRSAAAKDPKDEFKKIKDLNAKGQCGKCKKPVKTAKLSDGEEVNYCDSCRVTLWKD